MRPRRGPEPRDRFAALLAERKASLAAPMDVAPRSGPAPKPAQRSGCTRDPEQNVSRPIRAPREKVSDRDPADLAPFRPLPAVLSPPPMPVASQVTIRADVSRLAEQLVTRLRVGRAKEGAVVELRLSVGDRELDVRLVETVRGIELQTDADPSMRQALSRELAARGLDVTIEPRA
ncbi:MAG: hypothetical protein J0L92_41405 [Deltaproteobacteria bacterium]|nr:hypothetical protein [Deltaproteobacteria bacterium]